MDDLVFLKNEAQAVGFVLPENFSGEAGEQRLGRALLGSEAGDQRRIMTPEQAQTAGVDYMVIGRPVTQSADPAQTLRSINASLNLGA